MKRGLAFLASIAILCGYAAQCVYAQRGMGERTGVAQQTTKPDVVALSGTVLKVNTEPCKTTTGPSYLGTHFLLKTAKGKRLNIHLGPAETVAYVTEQLPIGENVTVDAFRTAKMPENHYVAKSLAFDGKTIQLRGESLRPHWAGSRIALGGQSGPQWRPRRGPGRGWGRGQRFGRSWGRGWGR